MTAELTRLAAPVESAFRAIRGRVLEMFRVAEATARLKADGSTVTDLDLELERRLGDALADIDPDFGVIGEETGVLRAGTPTWHLDPIDGTANFARRIPCFSAQTVLLDGNRPLFAAVYEPLHDDLTWAAEGAGTWREGQRVHVASREAGSEVVYVDVADTGLFVDDPGLAMRIRRAVYKVRALGSIGIHLRDVAVGIADGFVGGRGTPSPLHDLAPGVLLVREAGGVVTDANGLDPFRVRDSVVAGAPALHARMLAVLAASGTGE